MRVARAPAPALVRRLLLAALVTAPARADDASRAAEEIEEVVVTVMRTPETASEARIMARDISSAPKRTAEDALRLVPGDRETIANYDVVVVGQIDPSLVASSTQQLIVDQVTTAGCGLIFCSLQ